MDTSSIGYEFAPAPPREVVIQKATPAVVAKRMRMQPAKMAKRMRVPGENQEHGDESEHGDEGAEVVEDNVFLPPPVVESRSGLGCGRCRYGRNGCSTCRMVLDDGTFAPKHRPKAKGKGKDNAKAKAAPKMGKGKGKA